MPLPQCSDTISVRKQSREFQELREFVKRQANGSQSRSDEFQPVQQICARGDSNLMQTISTRSARVILAATAALVAGGIGISITGGVFKSSKQPLQTPVHPKGISSQRVEPSCWMTSCYSCHQDSRSGGLRLDSYASILKGGKSGSPIVPGDPETSLLIKMIRRNGKLKMPPKYALEASAIETLVAWIKAGARRVGLPICQ